MQSKISLLNRIYVSFANTWWSSVFVDIRVRYHNFRPCKSGQSISCCEIIKIFYKLNSVNFASFPFTSSQISVACQYVKWISSIIHYLLVIFWKEEINDQYLSLCFKIICRLVLCIITDLLHLTVNMSRNFILKLT
jgi:hypothetical protein